MLNEMLAFTGKEVKYSVLYCLGDAEIWLRKAVPYRNERNTYLETDLPRLKSGTWQVGWRFWQLVIHGCQERP